MSGRQWLLPASAFSVALLVYVSTLAPTVTGEDSGELIAAAHTLGIAHPPGYPLWCLLGKLFTIVVPFGGVAYRVNLLSAVLAACAAAVLSALVYRVTVRSGKPAPAVALTAALLFAFSRDFWAQSVVAEVYSLNILFLVLLLLLASLWEDTGQPRYLYLFCLVFGLSLTNHSTMGPLGLLIGLSILWGSPWLLRKPLLAVNLLAAFLVGLSLVLYLPIRSLADPAMDWGNPETFPATLRHLLRKQYTVVEGMRPRTLSSQLTLIAHYGRDLVMQFTPVLAPLVLLGAWRSWRVGRRQFFLLLALFLVGSYGIIWLFNYPAVREDLVIRRTFFLPTYAVACVWLGLGLLACIEALSRLRAARMPGLPAGSQWLLLGVVAFPIVWFHAENDKSAYYYADDYGRNVLRTLEPDAIFLPTSDHTTFPVIYLTVVEGLRPDVLIADKYGSIEDETLHRVFEENKASSRPPPRDVTRSEKILYLVEESGRPVFTALREPLPGSGFEFVPRGILFEALKPTARPAEAETERLWESYRWHPGTFTREHRDYSADMILSEWYLAKGRYQLERDRTAEALASLEKAAEHGRGIKEVLNNVGATLLEHTHADEAIPYLLEAWDVEPGYVQARRNLAVAHEQAGRLSEGYEWFVLQLEENPADVRLLTAAARGARALGRAGEALAHYFALAGLHLPDPDLYREITDYLREQKSPAPLIARYEELITESEKRREEEREDLLKAIEEGFPSAARPPAPAGGNPADLPTASPGGLSIPAGR